MPELGEEQLANTLMTKFSVDEDSVGETHRAVKSAEERLRQIREEMRTIDDQEFNAFQELRKEAQQLHFQQVENLIKRHWEERLSIVRGNTDEERRIQEQLNADLERLKSQQKMKEESDALEQDARSGVSGGGMPGIGGLLGSIGWGSIAGMGGIAGLMAIMAQSTGMLRETQAQARDIQEAAGRDEGFAYGLAPSLQRMQRRMRIDPGRLNRVASELVPIAPGGEAGGERIGELTEFAIEAGQARGIDPAVITRLMTQFNILEGTSLKNLEGRITDLVNMADEMGLPASKFAETMNGLIERGRIFNVSMDESSNLIRFFGRELQEGTVTMQQLSALQQVGAAAPLGLQAIVAQRLMQGGGGLAEKFKSVGADDPYFGAKAVQGILQGSYLTGEGKFVTPVEGSPEDEILRKQQQELRDIVLAQVREMAQDTSGGGPFQERSMLRHYLETFGVITPGMNPAAAEQEIDFIYGTAKPSRGALPDLPGGRRGALSPEELAAEGERSIMESVSALDRFKGAVGEMADSLNTTAGMINALMSGDMEKFNRLRNQLGQQSGENTPGAGMLGLLDSPLGIPLKFSPAGLMFQGIKLLITDQTKERVDIEAHEDNPLGDKHVSPSKI